MDRNGVSALRQAREARVSILAADVAEKFGVTVEDVRGRTRRWPVPDARHELMTLLWEEGLPFIEVGRLLDRDHSTVISGIRKVLGDDFAAMRAGRGARRCA